MPNEIENAMRIPYNRAWQCFDYDHEVNAANVSLERLAPTPAYFDVIEEPIVSLSMLYQRQLTSPNPNPDVLARAAREIPFKSDHAGQEAHFRKISSLDELARAGAWYEAEHARYYERYGHDATRWRRDVWGTGYEPWDVRCETDGNSVIVRFKTAWAPLGWDLWDRIATDDGLDTAAAEEVEARYEWTDPDGRDVAWAVTSSRSDPIALPDTAAELLSGPVPASRHVMCGAMQLEALFGPASGQRIAGVELTFGPPAPGADVYDLSLDPAYPDRKVVGWVTGDRERTLHVSAAGTDHAVTLPLDAAGLFAGWEGLRWADLSSARVRRGTDMTGMFHGCASLEEASLPGDATLAEGMFDDCPKMRDPRDQARRGPRR